MDFYFVAASVENQLQVAHVVRNFDLIFRFHFLGDVTRFVRVEIRLLLLDFRALGRCFGFVLDRLHVLRVLGLLKQPLVFTLVDVPEVDHGIVPVFGDVRDAHCGQLQIRVGELHCFV